MLSRSLSAWSSFKARFAGLFPVMVLTLANSLFLGVQAYYLLWKDPLLSLLTDKQMKQLHHATGVIFSFILFICYKYYRSERHLFNYVFNQALVSFVIYYTICYLYYTLFEKNGLIAGGALLVVCIYFSLHLLYKIYKILSSTKIA